MCGPCCQPYLTSSDRYSRSHRLRELRAGSTSVLVSHRLGAVRRAGRIVVVQDSRIRESGDHASLTASPDGVYAQLFRTQTEGYQEDPVPSLGSAGPPPGESSVVRLRTGGEHVTA
ncbi:hypothetical protein ABT120_38145 [Nonomuraea angiospora]|uniref:hypothetical protein n=1 Tax=Nonomuraea angiospora TaxID=46172 RepID=UPI00332966B2